MGSSKTWILVVRLVTMIPMLCTTMPLGGFACPNIPATLAAFAPSPSNFIGAEKLHDIVAMDDTQMVSGKNCDLPRPCTLESSLPCDKPPSTERSSTATAGSVVSVIVASPIQSPISFLGSGDIFNTPTSTDASVDVSSDRFSTLLPHAPTSQLNDISTVFTTNRIQSLTSLPSSPSVVDDSIAHDFSTPLHATAPSPSIVDDNNTHVVPVNMFPSSPIDIGDQQEEIVIGDVVYPQQTSQSEVGPNIARTPSPQQTSQPEVGADIAGTPSRSPQQTSQAEVGADIARAPSLLGRSTPPTSGQWASSSSSWSYSGLYRVLPRHSGQI